MKNKDYFLIKVFLILLIWDASAQELEWNVDNTSSNPGERVVAIIDAGTVGNYDGVGIVGQVIDNNGNWGYDYPTVGNFTAYIKFSSGLSYGIIQDIITDNITLRLRKISNSKFHLSAHIPYPHHGVRVLFRQVEGFPTVTMGNPTVNDSQGELVLAQPTYGTLYTESFGTGRVGIGTTTPDAKLTVKGNIHAEEVKVDLNVPGPDYVFKEGYDLKSLEEVQDYIKTHGHLPNIPSAQEMEENGIQLGELNMKLLEKIEELTLYTLRQEKDIKILENNNKKLMKMEIQLQKIEQLLKEKR